MFALLSLPFLASPFLVFGYSFVSFIKKGHRENLLLFSIGASCYFSLIYLILAISEIRKTKKSYSSQNLEEVAKNKKEAIIKKHEYEGMFVYINWNFLPIRYDFNFSKDIKNA